MADLVVTCPKGFWEEWIAEGDPAGEPWSGQEWGWYMGGNRPPIEPGDRLYVVAHGRLRGYAPVTALRWLCFDPRIAEAVDGAQGVYLDVDSRAPRRADWCICRHGGAAAVTIDEQITGFRGWRRVWWRREDERPFPKWRIP